jgi:hypothetical protein
MYYFSVLPRAPNGQTPVYIAILEGMGVGLLGVPFQCAYTHDMDLFGLGGCNQDTYPGDEGAEAQGQA